MERLAVSVIVRTIGRASLARSIDCALAQTWRPLEIVVVRAGGDSLPSFATWPEVPVRMVDRGPLNRPQAANAGLAAARGDWLMFLDDDDEILPTHAETLVAAALDSDDALVAYSATACLGLDGCVRKLLGEPFDRRALCARNYIHLGAAMFARRLVLEGYRFDETFERLQDWDFWLQLATRTHFAFTGLRTNCWWMESGASGAGAGRNFDAPGVERFLALLERKWRPWSASLDRKLGHHRRAAREAMERGDPAGVRAHVDAVDRILRGPVFGVRARAAPANRFAQPMISRAYRQ